MSNLLALLVSLAVTFSAAWIGSRFMPGAWYAALEKPAWTPPNAVFAPVWTLLYALMAIAAWLVWRRAGPTASGLALALYGLQLALNALWSYLFFGRQAPAAALFDIMLLWIVLVAVTIVFWRLTWAAGALLVPYVLWVSFAACLNFALWWLNR